MKLQDVLTELDKYDEDYDLVLGDKSNFEFLINDEDKIISLVPIN